MIFQPEKRNETIIVTVNKHLNIMVIGKNTEKIIIGVVPKININKRFKDLSRDNNLIDIKIKIIVSTKTLKT